jgi:hypothetical protein
MFGLRPWLHIPSLGSRRTQSCQTSFTASAAHLQAAAHLHGLLQVQGVVMNRHKPGAGADSDSDPEERFEKRVMKPLPVRTACWAVRTACWAVRTVCVPVLPCFLEGSCASKPVEHGYRLASTILGHSGRDAAACPGS